MKHKQIKNQLQYQLQSMLESKINVPGRGHLYFDFYSENYFIGRLKVILNET